MYARLTCCIVIATLAVSAITGCPETAPPVNGYANTTDPTNRGATYVGSAACSACHPGYAELSRLHGHGQALKVASGAPPEYPSEATRAGVPQPPPGQQWSDISAVVGGYIHGANFVDANGYLSPVQWNLTFPPNGTVAGFGPASGTATPFSFDCFRCHVTGAVPRTPDNPQSQGGRPGIEGTWAQAGVQCEACHGPGSRHIPNPAARNLYVNSGTVTCAQCHQAGTDPNVIPVAGGYINMAAQVNELRASGGHADFACGVCHEPHASTLYDPDRGVRNECRVCHATQNMALHQGFTLQRGDYTETLTCVSCHMPFTGLAASTAGPDVLGNTPGRMGDVRGHVFRINPDAKTYAQMFTPDPSAVLKDAQGQAGVSVDFVCLRCHTEMSNAFPLTVNLAAQIARNMHVAGGVNAQALLNR
jgi:hypothetical protein